MGLALVLIWLGATLAACSSSSKPSVAPSSSGPSSSATPSSTTTTASAPTHLAVAWEREHMPGSWSWFIEGDVAYGAAETSYGDSSSTVLLSLNLADGSVNWQKPAPLADMGYLTVAGDHIYLATNDAVTAYSTADGAQLWNTPLTDPELDNYTILLGGDKNNVIVGNSVLYATSGSVRRVLETGAELLVYRNGQAVVHPASSGAIGIGSKVHVVDVVTDAVKRTVTFDEPLSVDTGYTFWARSLEDEFGTPNCPKGFHALQVGFYNAHPGCPTTSVGPSVSAEAQRATLASGSKTITSVQLPDGRWRVTAVSSHWALLENGDTGSDGIYVTLRVS
jgi:PQQ-like domain